MISINCIHNDYTLCTNLKIKRTFWGLGPRMCIAHNNIENKCEYMEKWKRIIFPPSPHNLSKAKNTLNVSEIVRLLIQANKNQKIDLDMGNNCTLSILYNKGE